MEFHQGGCGQGRRASHLLTAGTAVQPPPYSCSHAEVSLGKTLNCLSGSLDTDYAKASAFPVSGPKAK